VQGEVFTDPQAVVGVKGGFVVAGLRSQQVVAVHYDFGRRSCTARVLGDSGRELNWHWHYAPAHHCFLAARPTLSCGYALDLATGACFSPLSGGAASRARDAWSLLKHGGLTKSQKLGVFHAPRKGWEPPGMRMRGLVLDTGSGELCFHHFTG